MKLFLFNLFLIPFLAACFGAVAWRSREILRANAQEQIKQNARILMATATSSRTYTSKQVQPLLQHKNFKIQEAIAEFTKTLDELPKEVDKTILPELTKEPARKAYLQGQQRFLDAQQKLVESMKNRPAALKDTEFHPQSVPAFAATEIFTYLRANYPDFHYKEATLNPTNLRDRATDWEADVVNQFRNDPELKDFSNIRETPAGTSLFLANPIKISNVSCLECHSTPDKAPPELVKQYGSANGFGWIMNEVIGAQIVSVPMSVPLAMAENSWRDLLRWLGGGLGGSVVLANLCAVVFLRFRK